MKSAAEFIAIALCMASFVPSNAQAQTPDPVADPQAVVVCGNARFTILTDRLVRMEWAEDGVFEDNATLAIINRKLPVPSFKTRKQGVNGILISTSGLTLKYDGSGKFSSGNLEVSFTMNGRKMTWHPGDDASANLMGTTRTLDGCTGFDKVSSRDNYLEPGILSRDGWAIVDESGRHLLVKDDSDWGEWVSERPDGERQDLYMFAYGHDYTAALGDFIKVAGRIPLPPKFTLGYWWSRYWAYTDEEMRQIASEMRSRGIPMDVFIIDMDWHHTYRTLSKRIPKDDFDQGIGWTGYSWNHDLIPDPDGLLDALHGMNYKVALNLHPASGIRPFEECYDAFVKDYLGRTSDYDGPDGYVFGDGGYQYAGMNHKSGQDGFRASVPYRMSQQAWADAYFNSVIHPIERQGVDFWWLDWQQWRESRYCRNLSSTFWINYAFFNDKVRQGRTLGPDAPRPFIYHRWGGLGSHRYQLGFSGDTYDEWDVLAFLPYFTATASNVGYGYWGHDIGGHMQKRNHTRLTEPEMYTRWLQYGVFTPIFKTHSTASANLDRRIWSYPSHYEYMKEAIELRYSLTPYIYDAARQAYDSGVSITRPLYYYYPEDERAYLFNQEFFFGDNILASVICSPAGENGLSERRIWFPKGNWFDMAHHRMVKGGCEKTLHYAIDENPWFVKAGQIIPLAPEGIQNLQEKTNAWRIMIVPGDGKATYIRYEDDGVSQHYVKDYALTTISKESNGKSYRVTVSPVKGSYAGMPLTRKLSLVLESYGRQPSEVKVNGRKATTSLHDGTLVVDIPELPVDETLMITVK